MAKVKSIGRRLILAIVERLGPLVHWRYDASLDPRWCTICGIYTQGKSCPDHPEAPYFRTDPGVE